MKERKYERKITKENLKRKVMSICLIYMMLISIVYPNMYSNTVYTYADTITGNKIVYAKIWLVPYGKDKDDAIAAPKDYSFNIETKTSKATIKTDEYGIIKYDVPESQRTDNEKYKVSFLGNDDYLPLESAEIKEISSDAEASSDAETSGSALIDIIAHAEASANPVYIHERYTAKGSDYVFKDAKNGYLKQSSSYTIKADSGLKVCLNISGDGASSELDIPAVSNVLKDFYIVKDGKVSKPIKNTSVSVDTSAPNILSITAKPAATGTTVKVKRFGIFNKNEEAALELTVKVQEAESGIDEEGFNVKAGDDTFKPVSVSSSKNSDIYTSTILISRSSLSDNAKFMLNVSDLVGNKSSDTLIRHNEPNVSAEAKASTFTLDSISPTIEPFKFDGVVKKSTWYDHIPEFEFTVKDNGSGIDTITFYCNDAKIKAWDDFSSKEDATKEFSIEKYKLTNTDSVNGEYTYKIQVEDNAGNISVYQEIIKIDNLIPVISIEGVGEGKHYKEIPTIEVKEDENYASDPENKIYVYVYFDNSDVPYREKIVSAESSVIIPSTWFIKDGEYEIKVYAEDGALHKSTIKTVSGIIKDSVSPTGDIEILQKSNTNNWYNFLPSFKITTSDKLSDLDTIRLSMGDHTLYQIGNVKAKDLTSPVIKSLQKKYLEPDSNGKCRIDLECIDICGNKLKKHEYIYVDLDEPVVNIEGPSDGDYINREPSINIVENEKYSFAKGNMLAVTIKRNKKIVFQKEVNKTNKYTISTNIFVKDGKYNITATAKDAALNIASPVSVEFIKDSTKPEITLSGIKNNASYNRAKTLVISVKEHNYSTNRVSINAYKKIGKKGKKKPFNILWTNKSEFKKIKKTFKDTGTYNIKVTSIDKAGNEAIAKSISFTIDTSDPEIKIMGITNGKVYTQNQIVKSTVEFKDDYISKTTTKLTKAGKDMSDYINRSIPEEKKFDGEYTLVSTATDKAGNQSTRTVKFIINKFGSYYNYSNSIKSIQNKTIKAITEPLTITECNISKIISSKVRITKDGKEVGEISPKISYKNDTNPKTTTYEISPENFKEDGVYEINVMSKDEAGNETDTVSETGKIAFIVDNSAPGISFSDNLNKKVIKAPFITANVIVIDNLCQNPDVQVIVNGRKVSVKRNKKDKTVYNFSLTEGTKQEVKAVAIDDAGNVKENSTIVSIHNSSSEYFIDKYRLFLFGGLGIIFIAGTITLIRRKKTTYPEEDGGKDMRNETNAEQ